MKREVFYPPVGIAHVTNKLSDLILYKGFWYGACFGNFDAYYLATRKIRSGSIRKRSEVFY